MHWSLFQAQLTMPSGNLSMSASSSSLFLGPGFFLACFQCGLVLERSWIFCCCSSSFSLSSSWFMTSSSWVSRFLNSDGVSSTGSGAGFSEAFLLNRCITFPAWKQKAKPFLLSGFFLRAVPAGVLRTVCTLQILVKKLPLHLSHTYRSLQTSPGLSTSEPAPGTSSC